MNRPQDERRQSNSEENRSEIRALVPYYENPNDEMDLVEVGVSLWRRWKLMLAIFLVCVAGALLAVFLIPRSYSYSTTIEIGSQVVGTQIQPIESSGNAASKLQQGFLPEVVQQYAQSHGLDPRKFTFDAEAPGQADLVVITGQGPLAQAEAYMGIEKSAAQLLINADARITKNQKAQLMAQFAQAKATLDQLKDPENQQLLKSQIGNLQAYQKLAQDQQIASSHNSGNASVAMSLLLLGSQAQQANQQLLALQQQLNNLPSNIASQEAALRSLRAQLDNLQVTRIVAGPMRSIKPVVSSLVIVILGVVVGMILALIAAVLANYCSAVRRRIAGERRSQAP